MLSFELRDAQRVDAMLAAFRLVLPALSLGGVESLVRIPSRTSHRKMSRGQRERAGISDGLVRVSVGVEDFEDLGFLLATRGEPVMMREGEADCSHERATSAASRNQKTWGRGNRTVC